MSFGRRVMQWLLQLVRQQDLYDEGRDRLARTEVTVPRAEQTLDRLEREWELIQRRAG